MRARCSGDPSGLRVGLETTPDVRDSSSSAPDDGYDRPMKSFKRRPAFLALALAVLLAAVAFACGSNDDVPPTCEGAACIDGGGLESGTQEGSTNDGPVGDAPSDSPNETGDAGACKLEAPDADAGPSGTLQWALNFGVTGFTYPTAIARDPANGDIAVTGYFWGTTDFGGGPLTSVAPTDGSGSDVFVARFDKDGGYKWAGAWGNGSNFAANAVAVGPAGEMVFAGLLRTGSVDFGCGTLTAAGSPTMFVAKLAKSGACVWSKGFGPANVTTASLDGAGNIVLAGASPGGVDFGGGPLPGFYLAKLAPSGTHAWSKGFAATTSYGGPYVALDAQGNAVFAGSFSNSIDLGGGALKTAGAATGDPTNAAFAAKFDAAGKHVWSKLYGEGVGGKNTSVSGVATDACGNAILHGPFGGTVNFGAGALLGIDSSKSYAFLAKLAPNGGAAWSRALTATFTPTAADAFGLGSLAPDRSGGFTIAPRLMGDAVNGKTTTDFGGGPLTSVGRGSVAIASFNADAQYRWAHGAGGPSTATASSAAFPTAAAAWGSSVVVAGAFNNCTTVCNAAPPGTTLLLAGTTLTAASGQDLFIASFTP